MADIHSIGRHYFAPGNRRHHIRRLDRADRSAAAATGVLAGRRQNATCHSRHASWELRELAKRLWQFPGARTRQQDLYIYQCTADTRPEDLLVTPVLAESGKIAYHASPLVTRHGSGWESAYWTKATV